MKRQLVHSYNDIISLENLCLAWQEFIIGKKIKSDVQKFERHLIDNIVELHEQLVNRNYGHGNYDSFYVTDPKRRHIHKASVRDRLLHHAIYRILYPFFDSIFIADSFSCRDNKGTHRAISRFKKMIGQVSKNNTRTIWVLKCDIKKFFASIDHNILLNILKEYIPDQNILWLLENVIDSFYTDGQEETGLPLGNLTSQLFANIYLNILDQYMKHQLKAKFYIRYADDFVILSDDKEHLEDLVINIKIFVSEKLKLILHPQKIFIKTIASGMDFLGWVIWSNHKILRSTTRRRLFVGLKNNPTEERLQSYLGLLKNGEGFKIRQELINNFWLL
ncbi:MAG: group II intron reverse transcriptase domain-containing protein [Candidatus Magasanikbacteria bacterium]|nr:group II intron reverse transcriptase domain-containing protein [Candidatus Magasanikbacteria bacterium]